MTMLDVREATGRNDGPEVAVILRSVGLGEGYAWCGAFVFRCHQLAAVPLPPPPSTYAWAATWTASRVIWRNADLKRLQPLPDQPAPGDVFGIWFPDLGRVGHVGLVRDWQPGSKYMTTVEGNTNDRLSREGDGVYAKRRLKAQLYRVSRWAC